jgi:hypothetical protein
MVPVGGLPGLVPEPGAVLTSEKDPHLQPQATKESFAARGCFVSA